MKFFKNHLIPNINNILLIILSCELAGVMVAIHLIFTSKTNQGVPAQLTTYFVYGTIFGSILSLVFGLTTKHKFSKSISGIIPTLFYFLIFSLIFYGAYILFENSRFIFTYPTLQNMGHVYLYFLSASGLLALLLRKKVAAPFSKASTILFFVLFYYILFRLQALLGFLTASIYVIYLIALGNLIVKLINRVINTPINSALEEGIASFVLGISANYLIWYLLGWMALFYSNVALGIVSLVLLIGMLNNRHLPKALLQGGKKWFRQSELDNTSATLLNIILFTGLILLAQLCIKFPGSGDSAGRMYCATIYKFANYHEINFLPFYHNWQLIFQPLLFELNGLPIYLLGGISALRFFNAIIFISFTPVLVLISRRCNLPRQIIFFYLLLYSSSTFILRTAYSDKPEVFAFPAFTVLLIYCAINIRKTANWNYIIIGALAAIIAATKPILIIGAVSSIILMLIFISLRENSPWGKSSKKGVITGLLLFLVIFSINPIQNILLRGNPIHPYAPNVFPQSKDRIEEVKLAVVPKRMYEYSMPILSPSLISLINLDRDKGIYKPYMSVIENQKNFRFSARSINICIVIITVLLPILFFFNRSRIYLFCGLTAIINLLIWFAWIGDALRYSVFVPAISLFISLSLYKSGFSSVLHTIWKNLIIVISIMSIPLSIYYTVQYEIPDKVYALLSDPGAKSGNLNTKNPVTTYLEKYRKKTNPILLTADMHNIDQYGFFQPNFVFQMWKSYYVCNMVYLSKIQPTHLLTNKELDKSEFIIKYPFMKKHLTLDHTFKISPEILSPSRFGADIIERKLKETKPQEVLHLYRFKSDIPWDKYFIKFSQLEKFSVPLLIELEEFSTKYNTNSGRTDGLMLL